MFYSAGVRVLPFGNPVCYHVNMDYTAKVTTEGETKVNTASTTKADPVTEHVLALIDKQIDAYEKAMPRKGDSVTVGLEQFTQPFKRLREQVVAAPRPD